jgi:hypothetical protein
VNLDTLSAWVIVGLLVASPWLLGGLVIFGLGAVVGVLAQRHADAAPVSDSELLAVAEAVGVAR